MGREYLSVQHFFPKEILLLRLAFSVKINIFCISKLERKKVIP